MVSSDETKFGSCNPYVDESCPYCRGPHYKEMNDTMGIVRKIWLMGLEIYNLNTDVITILKARDDLPQVVRSNE
ncbi:hypothetical protein R3W88_001051 [Solanum pinnatisectum]|uniref:Uncharacterized protein n=1 Tax=Solanum pinnatisectum TaxID=50273 RepID=A0AAV9MJU9_9SOLN|nr:hypothetical protein R3W88_001051 [Solanum pinnatisectum]